MPGWFADLVDGALERSVLGSFTRVGFAARRRLDRWAPLEGLDLAGRVVVITGATSGLGLEAATALACLGATVEIVARDDEKARAVVARVRAEAGHDAVDHVVADTGDLDAVRRAADTLLARHPAVHVLIHNAGALDAVRSTSPQGLEQTVASQVVGPCLLTALLRPALRAGAPSRVIWVASGGMYTQPLGVDRLEMPPDRYDGTVAYARAKRAQVTLAEMWAERLAADGVVVHAMHPGWADTPGVARSLPGFRRVLGPVLRTPAEGADTIVWLAAADGPPVETTGRFWLDRRPRPTHVGRATRRSDTPEERARLWAWVDARCAGELSAPSGRPAGT